MIPRDRVFGFVFCLLAATAARAGDDALARPIAKAAPLEIPHITALDLAQQARKRARKPSNIENHQFLYLTPELKPVVWTKPSDIRARIVTPELRKAPVIGWIAQNLYRSRNDNGWCLEVDPGEGEYVVFYRLNL